MQGDEKWRCAKGDRRDRGTKNLATGRSGEMGEIPVTIVSGKFGEREKGSGAEGPDGGFAGGRERCVPGRRVKILPSRE